MIASVTPLDAMSTVVLIKFPFAFVTASDLNGPGSMPFYRPRVDDLKDVFIKRPDVIAAYTWMVIDAYNSSPRGPVIPCSSVLKDTSEYREDIGDDVSVMARCFKITGNREDFVLTKDLTRIAKFNSMSITVIKDRLKKMGAFYDKNCRVNGQAHGRGMQCVKLLKDALDVDAT